MYCLEQKDRNLQGDSFITERVDRIERRMDRKTEVTHGYMYSAVDVDLEYMYFMGSAMAPSMRYTPHNKIIISSKKRSGYGSNIGITAHLVKVRPISQHL